MSLTIKQLLNKSKKDPAGDIGLEVELEFEKEQAWDLNPKSWDFNEEHSLRNRGYEIVSKGPIKLEAFDHMVTSLCANINQRSPIECNRTSVHVHVNQTKAQVLHVLNAAVAYWLLETPLTRYCGVEREGHHFCLRLKDAEALIPILCDSLKSNKPLVLGDKVRYAGLNLSALNKFGSLEFRTMRGTTDPALITSWARGLHHLCKTSRTFETPAHVFDFYLESSKVEFIRHFLTKDLADAVISIPNYKDMMNESASIVCALAYAEEWKDWDKRIEEAWNLSQQKKEIPGSPGWAISQMDFDLPSSTMIVHDEVDYP